METNLEPLIKYSSNFLQAIISSDSHQWKRKIWEFSAFCPWKDTSTYYHFSTYKGKLKFSENLEHIPNTFRFENWAVLMCSIFTSLKALPLWTIDINVYL